MSTDPSSTPTPDEGGYSVVKYPNLDTVEDVVAAVVAEVTRAAAKHPPMNSAHEGYAVLLEELDEAWAEIKSDRPEAARQEMVQVAAMAVRFIVDLRPKAREHRIY